MRSIPKIHNASIIFFRLGFCLNTLGELQLSVNNRVAGCLLTDLPTDIPLWLIIDIYGSTQSVQFVQEGNS
jgi:hypothetical protein